MTKEEALAELEKLNRDGRDTEMGHVRADEILCELLSDLGYQDVVDAYDVIGKWYA